MERNNKRTTNRIKPNRIENKFSIQGLLKSETIIIATATGISYLAAYFYQFGYFYFFSIPVSFMVLNNTEMISFMAVFFSMIIALSNYWFILSGFNLFSRDNIISGHLFFAAIFLLFSVIIIFSFIYSEWVSIILLITMLLLLCFYRSIFEFLYKIAQFLGRFLKYSPKSNGHNIEINIDSYNFNKLGATSAFFIALLFALQTLGSITAKMQTNFYILDLTTECVVLYKTSSSVICSPFNRNSKEV
jgi:hypothetical protein